MNKFGIHEEGDAALSIFCPKERWVMLSVLKLLYEFKYVRYRFIRPNCRSYIG